MHSRLTNDRQLEPDRDAADPPQAQVHLSVVASCYNEQEVLSEFYRRVKAVCEASSQSYEIVLVNDGSRDRTWEIMKEIAENDPYVVAVDLSRNHGHQLALTAGLSLCRGNRILILDADLQDPPELLGEMSRIMDSGADVVYGQRRSRAGETILKLGLSAAFYRILSLLTNEQIPKDTGDFRLISRRALDILLEMPEWHRFIRGMVSWIGFVQKPLLYDRDARFAGVTKYPLSKLIKLSVDAVTGFSVKPLRVAVYCGIACSGMSFVIMMYAFYSWLFKPAVPGWTSTMVGMTLIGGVQLLVLGIMGEYLGRLYDQSKGRPLFIIRDVIRRE
jgi:dolichol-phosphate mannosyltransferase